MQFKIQRRQLSKRLQDVIHIISSKTVIPILAGIKIDVNENEIILTGSNSDITIQAIIPQKINGDDIITDIKPGSIVLPVPQLPEIINKLPEDIVDFTVDENYKTVIKSGKAVFTLYGQNSDEYPKLSLQQNDHHLTLNIKDLKKMIRQTVFAVSTMETRPIFTGVNMILENNELTFTATDSHRLSRKSIEVKDHQLDQTNIVMPGRSLQELNKILNEQDEEVKVTLVNNQVIFSTEYLFFSSRLLNGQFPDTNRLIPKDSDTVMKVYVNEFIHMIERAAVLSNKEQNNVIDIETEDNLIRISSKLIEIGNVNEQLNAISIEGDPIKLSFSSKYMLESLKTMDTDIVEIYFSGPMKPFVIKSPNDHKILQLILPVKTF